MKQPIFTPPVANCAICGNKATVIDWEYNMQYKVYCDGTIAHTVKGKGCNTPHRAICRWNNEQAKIMLENSSK